MASSLHSNLNFLPASQSMAASARLHRFSIIRCGPRDNRGPLLKGRILSTEAIQAIQALKRAHRTDRTNLPTHILSRLIKSDLIATFKELLRQDHCILALKVFSTLRSEYSVDFGNYADLVLALSRNGFRDEIDALFLDMEKEGGIQCDDIKGLSRLIKALVNAERKESTVRIYEMMRKIGWGSRVTVDEYLGKVLSRGLRRFGEDKMADEIDEELRRSCRGVLEKPRV
ncbi:protein THYLAKOID ASSEMBLY 8, chloroplastic [Olea europaea var. sylvestris]|uniref:THYLAKOID ASSEMBLY 8, chloroplastic n=1 Tax=Olea europaea subsp. europaea TaxID=158383 RepID=A0A8S0UX99_OLEEU|nr:protein THYLAKOID ASSEMBLY 8, chloroplastic [Olea europaea var. sylvestris]CAA3023683.1 THYLAKOID ASSEMBLY 8, chloroplastic [Olea europaea subsp. europaea]